MDRRRFLQCLAIAGSAPKISFAKSSAGDGLGPLRADPAQILDLPHGFRYEIISRAGQLMDDGLRVPGAHDGMAVFSGDAGRWILVCNHELGPTSTDEGAFDQSVGGIPEHFRHRLYDTGGGVTPGLGGTTTTILNPTTGEPERQFLSLAGTEINCAGGATPWGSWLSCEECFETPGLGLSYGRLVRRDRAHGYVFEVPAAAEGLVEPVPITAMGRFEHEAAAVHERTARASSISPKIGTTAFSTDSSPTSRKSCIKAALFKRLRSRASTTLLHTTGREIRIFTRTFRCRPAGSLSKTSITKMMT